VTVQQHLNRVSLELLGKRSTTSPP